MIEVTVLYPARDGGAFDMDYYMKTHIPLFRNRMGAAMRDISVVRGLSGPMPGSRPPFVAMLHATFESVEAFEAAFAPHVAEIQGDIPKYTDIEPVLQIGERL
ncbi:MAG TPA: EthD family reductase [Bryobacteraceae bacterium]